MPAALLSLLQFPSIILWHGCFIQDFHCSGTDRLLHMIPGYVSFFIFFLKQTRIFIAQTGLGLLRLGTHHMSQVYLSMKSKRHKLMVGTIRGTIRCFHREEPRGCHSAGALDPVYHDQILEYLDYACLHWIKLKTRAQGSFSGGSGSGSRQISY